jgi:hypothetical protein
MQTHAVIAHYSKCWNRVPLLGIWDRLTRPLGNFETCDQNNHDAGIMPAFWPYSLSLMSWLTIFWTDRSVLLGD